MIDAATFWSLPRNTGPSRLFTEILPRIPPLLAEVTLPRPVNVHVLGGGGGVWTVRLVEGRAEVGEGASPGAIAALVLSRAHLREVVGGALRDRGIELMRRLGRPGRFPDLRGLPVDPARAEAVGALRGSVAVEVHDRAFRESYRFVVTLGGSLAGGREPDYETATTTLHVDADELVEQLASGMALAALLKGSRARLEGDPSLPLRALRAAFGGAVERGRGSGT